MDFQKAKIYLDKLNREFARMSKDPENIIRIDVDIMSSYVRELYDAILTASDHTNAPKAEPTPVRVAPKPPVMVAPIEITPAPPAPAVMAEIPPPAPPPYVREEPPAPAPPPPAIEVPKPAPQRPAAPAPAGLEVLFEEKEAKELAEKLAESAISDLKKAIPLNDRLRYTSELFAGDGQKFEFSLAALNSFSHFEEAREYLIQQCVVQYAWTDKKRVEAAKAFVKLVRRRHK